nr:hypothetical protein [Tanacetum cinerariifolium]
ALVDAYESDKIILDTYRETVTLKRRRDNDEDKDEELSAGPDRGLKRHKEGKEPEAASPPSETTTRSAGRSTTGSRSRQASASESAFAEEPVQTTSQIEEPSHPEFDTDFSNFIMNRLRVDTLTPELLAGPTYDLMKGSCKSLIELEYHLEGPLPLIPDNRGRRVIPFKHFINNGLEYLHRGACSRKYTTSVTKTKATYYGHIKWIEDLVPMTMWKQEPIDYDKHALWGVSHWGRKRQQFYGLAINREYVGDVYSKRRIIVVTELQIMFTRSIVIQRRMEDLQLGVESNQKRLNLTKPDTYKSYLNCKEAYTAYSNPRGFIYQNKDKKNRLMRIDELCKFSDGTLTHVRTAIDDRLKGIRMRYLPQTIRRKSDKDRAAAMIQAIDKRMKTRRIMRSLERFVGGRLYEGDFRMLQRTIRFIVCWSYLSRGNIKMEVKKFYIERHDSSSHQREARKHMRILIVVRIKAVSRYMYDYLSKIVLRRGNFQEHKIAKKDFKNMCPNNFEDLNLLLLQGHLVGSNKIVFSVNNNERKIWRFNEVYKFSDGTLTRIPEALDYRVKEYRVNWLNLGINTWFWTAKNVTRSKEFIRSIERRLKTRRIF